jgi:hypothetical protein
VLVRADPAGCPEARVAGSFKSSSIVGRVATSIFILSFALLLVVLALFGSGCGDDAADLVGIWTSAEQGETLEFAADGTAIFTMEGGEVSVLTWEIKGSGLVLGVAGEGTRRLGYSLEGDVLTLTFSGEEPTEYTRVESEVD